MNKEITDEQRKKRNRKRNLRRKRQRERNRMPPIIAWSKSRFEEIYVNHIHGDKLDASRLYEEYAIKLIEGAKRNNRRYEFPVEPMAGVAYPSRIRHRRGGTSS